MSGLLGDQVDITSRAPLKVRRLDDTSTVNDVAAEVITFQYDNAGALASATGQAAGTMIYAKTVFDGFLNSFKDKVGDMKDSSFGFVTGTVLTTPLAIDIERSVDNWRRMTVTEKFTEMAKHMKTEGQYWIDHADGTVWGIAAAIVADDTANYSYKAPVTGGGGPAANTTETDPLNEKFSSTSLVDTTDITAATHYYPGATGDTADLYKDISLSGKFIDADGTLTLTLEVMNDEDTAAGDWVQAYFYDDKNNSVVNSLTVTNGTLTMLVSLNNINFRYYRWVVVASGATNTVILKERKKAL